MKTSFITTVYNEEESILSFLDSLAKQTKKPNEIVIVDARSTDKTREILYSFFSKHKNIRYTIIVKPGNRSKGRNIAIKNATHSIILCSDAGCTLDKNWVKNITQPFLDKKVDVVSGFYQPIAKNVFEKSLATYTSVMPDRIDKENFLPSTRSVAVKKSAWKKVKGFPEYLDTCEDMIFDKKLKDQGFNFTFKKNAIVYWPQRKNIFQALVQFFNYAKGDGLAHYFRPQTPLLFLRYIFAISLLILGLTLHSFFIFTTCCILLAAYILWSIVKNYRYVKKWQALFILPMLQVTSDIAVLFGTASGLLQSMLK